MNINKTMFYNGIFHHFQNELKDIRTYGLPKNFKNRNKFIYQLPCATFSNNLLCNTYIR